MSLRLYLSTGEWKVCKNSACLVDIDFISLFLPFTVAHWQCDLSTMQSTRRLGGSSVWSLRSLHFNGFVVRNDHSHHDHCPLSTFSKCYSYFVSLFLFSVICVCFYATTLICYISLKEAGRKDDRNCHWSPVLQTISTENDQKDSGNFIWFEIVLKNARKIVIKC